VHTRPGLFALIDVVASWSFDWQGLVVALALAWARGYRQPIRFRRRNAALGSASVKLSR